MNPSSSEKDTRTWPSRTSGRTRSVSAAAGADHTKAEMASAITRWGCRKRRTSAGKGITSARRGLSGISGVPGRTSPPDSSAMIQAGNHISRTRVVALLLCATFALASPGSGQALLYSLFSCTPIRCASKPAFRGFRPSSSRTARSTGKKGSGTRTSSETSWRPPIHRIRLGTSRKRWQSCCSAPVSSRACSISTSR